MNGASTAAARQTVGARLRHLRLDRGLTLEAVAAETGSSAPTLSRMERGQAPFDRAFLSRLLTLYGITDPYQQEALISVAVGRREPGWWDQTVPLEETVLWHHEQAATLIRTYATHFVPDLLRTPEYEQAVQRAVQFPTPPGEVTLAKAENLRRRQESRRARLWAVIEETVLRRPLGGDVAAHVRQLDELLKASREPDITLQILPADSAFLPPEPFTVLRLPDQQVIVFHRFGGEELGDLREHERYGLLLDQLAGVARTPAESALMLAAIRDQLREGT
ncbi:helix-turn-helix transcriptional regulator [Nonomuraea fastidiosa]|uniref:helix-turn-helix domain-containing protein n=1 Tax=Nonomuraea TaxID=83681 RepID=UPI00341AE7D0